MIPHLTPRLRITVLSICGDITAETGQRTVDLVGLVMQSDHTFSGLYQVLGDEPGLSGMLTHWIAGKQSDILEAVSKVIERPKFKWPHPMIINRDLLAL